MLVDLARNDLGRVCTPGTVRVVEFGAVERYSHVWHIVSTVEPRGAPKATTRSTCLRSTFPAGTLTGAPKVRAMELIDELEPVRRGIYGGARRVSRRRRRHDVAIAIRTAVMRGGIAYVQARAGVVADSKPELEELETRNKARAVLQAIATAETLRPVHAMRSRRVRRSRWPHRDRRCRRGTAGRDPRLADDHHARAHPFTDDVVSVSGRTIDGAVTALALVALAGVVAVLATKGVARRVIGALVAASRRRLDAGAASARCPRSAPRARVTLVRDSASLRSPAPPHVGDPSRLGRAVARSARVLVVAGRAADRLARRHGGRAMSARYEAPRPSTRSRPSAPARMRVRCGPRWNAARIRPPTTRRVAH